MRIAILQNPPSLSAYIDEILQTWGLNLGAFVSTEALTTLDPATTPVVLCPNSTPTACTADLLAYTHRGGTVVTFLPEGDLATAAGLVYQSEKETPLRLRPVHYPIAGLAGELLPIVGRAATYSTTPETIPLAYLSHPGQYHDESIGAVESVYGAGRLVAFACDLPLSVLLLRQGDPTRAEVIPTGDGCARPSHMACDLGASDSSWIPFADLLARMLVDQVRRHIPAPVPLLSHLPGTAPGILLYSGDEDHATVAANEDEFAAVHAAGGRMSLYIIPDRTHSTRADAERYARHHDLGPHPNIRPLDGASVAARLSEFRHQIELFRDLYHLPAHSLRNHCTAWAGYLDPVEIMQELGVRMDGNYFSGTYMKDRIGSPYAGFGSAMPMRFCRPDGDLFDVYQQHTHLSDDVLFGEADYSYKLSPANFATQSTRIFSEIATRFHTPYAVCIHPGNWVKYSGAQGRTLLDHANQFDCPIWSFEQWLAFCQTRRTWRCTHLSWTDQTMECQFSGDHTHPDLYLVLPVHFQGRNLGEVYLNDEPRTPYRTTRYHEQVALVPLANIATPLSLRTCYQSPLA